jgi:uncharacterized SAM-binding protein YcdF (DUF218 family)
MSTLLLAYDGTIDIGELKPILGALVLPPAGPLLLALLGLWLARRHRGAGTVLAFTGLAALWLASCHAVSIALAQALLPAAAPLQPAQLQNVQAIVVLGGGVLPQAPEYGQAQPAGPTLARLRYGAWLARQSGKPVAFAGAIGWAATGLATESEGAVARRTARSDWGLELRWVDDRSRDTGENAAHLRALMQPDGVQRIALVTHAWHMPRAQLAFEQAGFEVTPAPMGFATPRERAVLEWLPSTEGLAGSRQVLREWLALRLSNEITAQQ